MDAQRPPCSCSATLEQNPQAGPGPCQDLCPPCPCDPPGVPLGVTSTSLPADPRKTSSSGEEPFTFESPGMCVMRFPLQKSILTVELCPPEPAGTCPPPPGQFCVAKPAGICLENREKLPAAEPCAVQVLELGVDEACEAQGTILGDPCGSQSGISVDPCGSQSGISTHPCGSQSGIPVDPCGSQSGIPVDPCGSQSGIPVDPCGSQSGISMNPCTSQSGISADPCPSQCGIPVDPCGSQSGISMDPCRSQSGISTDPCGSQSGISTDPCTPQSQGSGDAGDAKASRSQSSPRSPFRLNSCTSSIVERCLSRCQGWFRPKN